MIRKVTKIALISTLIAVLLIAVVGAISSGEYGLFFLNLIMSLQAFVLLFFFSLMYVYIKNNLLASIASLRLRYILSSVFSVLLSVAIYALIENYRLTSKGFVNFFVVSIIVGLAIPIIDKYSDNLFSKK
jgi:hypothetical protein